MRQQSGRRLAVLAVLWMATLAGCGGATVATEEPTMNQTEQGLKQCNLNGLCDGNNTCVYGVCRPRCDTTNYVCSGTAQCCPGVMNPNTGIGSAPYCAPVCMD